MVREKNRYLLLEVICGDHLKWKADDLQYVYKGEIYSAILEAVQKAHGLIGYAQCSYTLKVKLLNKLTRILYVRIGRSDQRVLVTSLPFVDRIGKIKCTLRTLHMGGSIRSCHKVLMKYHREQLNVLLTSRKTESEKKAVHDAIEEGLAYVKQQQRIGYWELEKSTPSIQVQK